MLGFGTADRAAVGRGQPSRELRAHGRRGPVRPRLAWARRSSAACRFVRRGGRPRGHHRRWTTSPTPSHGARRHRRTDRHQPSYPTAYPLPQPTAAPVTHHRQEIHVPDADRGPQGPAAQRQRRQRARQAHRRRRDGGRPGHRRDRQDRGQRRGQRLHPDHRRPRLPRGAGGEGRRRPRRSSRSRSSGPGGTDGVISPHATIFATRARPTAPSRPTSRG